MSDPAGRHWLTFNGEIYNCEDLLRDLRGAGWHPRTRTDTELVLASYERWGDACLERLDGMFALALYDLERGRLLVGRDRAGEKPLFLRIDQAGVVFASELKALLADPSQPRELEPMALDLYLACGYVPGDRCILRGYRKLLPGHALSYEPATGDVRQWTYWRPPEGAPETTVSAEDLVDRLEVLLEASVQRQLVADVPVGVMLSGGIDSSLVAAFASRAGAGRIRSFTISFPGEREFDEAPHARKVAEFLGCEHRELAAEPASVELLPELAAQFDEPLADSSLVPTFLVSRVIREHATVALGGDGGDELFGGYLHYSRILRQSSIQKCISRPVLRLAGCAASALPPGVRGRNYLMGLAASPAEMAAHATLLFDRKTRHGLAGPALRESLGGSSSPGSDLWDPHRSLLQNATRVDFRTYLPDDILAKVDRASMLASLEVRAPWLDRALVEFAFGSVPERLKAVGSDRKILLRMLARRVLPEDFDVTRKQGFSIPARRWLTGDWGRFAEAVLSEADTRLWNPRAVVDLLRGQQRGRTNSERIFALMMFELWRRHYGIRFGSP